MKKNELLSGKCEFQAKLPTIHTVTNWGILVSSVFDSKDTDNIINISEL